MSVKQIKMKQVRKIIHVELLNPPPEYRKHYYFGSVAAIKSVIPTKVLGIGRLRICSDLKDGEYIGRKAIIRRGELISQNTNRGIRRKEVEDDRSDSR